MDLLTAAQTYLAHGYRPIPIPEKQKRPCLNGWQHLHLTQGELPQHFNGTGNIGLLLGEPSGNLVDVDLDCPEALDLADQYLPPTPAITGRPAAPKSHRWYIADGVETKRHRDPNDRSCLVELRSTGGQTLVGPSIHPSGEPYDILDAEPARVDGGELAACVARLAEAIVTVRYGEVRNTGEPGRPSRQRGVDDEGNLQRAIAYLDAMPPAISGQGGHNQTYAAATAMVHGFGIDPDTAYSMLRDRYNSRCEPPWSEKELRHKIDDAVNKPHDKPFGWLRDSDSIQAANSGVDLSQFMVSRSPPDNENAGGGLIANPISVGDLVAKHPRLRAPIIHNLLRAGETMNIIASPKTGKSWLALDLAIAIVTGSPWLGLYDTVPGDVLIIDNELHRETSANRLPRVAQARNVPMTRVGDRLFIENIRGRLCDIFSFASYFESLEPGRFKLIVLDAFYRFMPMGGDENDNGTMANIYNAIDYHADRLGCSFVLIHHSTKGNQSSKSVTDVGAGAGAQSRATDTHLVLRPHEENAVVVLDAAVRSWPPIEPMCLRWEFPVWHPAPELDPAELRGERSKKRKTERKKQPEPKTEPDWNTEKFVDMFISDRPITLAELRENTAPHRDLSWRRASDLLEIAETGGLIERQRLPGRGGPIGFIRCASRVAGGREK